MNRDSSRPAPAPARAVVATRVAVESEVLRSPYDSITANDLSALVAYLQTLK